MQGMRIVYPPDGRGPKVEVDGNELRRLDAGQWLNDSFLILYIL